MNQFATILILLPGFGNRDLYIFSDRTRAYFPFRLRVGRLGLTFLMGKLCSQCGGPGFYRRMLLRPVSLARSRFASAMRYSSSKVFPCPQATHISGRLK
jgi:hypothetical protein